MMKRETLILLLLGGWVFITSCSNKSQDVIAIEKAGKYIETKPEEAKTLLDSIYNPFALNDKYCAQYFFLSCKIADFEGSDLPLHADIQRALEWYKKKGNKQDLAQMHLYLGRSYVAKEAYPKAMSEYLEALHMAVDNNLVNQAGYISSYIGDLYSDMDDLYAASQKYEEAADYFKRAGNQKSYLFALRDLGRSWALVDSLDKALPYYLLADSLAGILNDSHVRSTVLNGLGNVYRFKGAYEKAEKTLLLSLELDTLERIPSLNALTDIYIKQGNYSKARKLLDSIANIDIEGNYQYYLSYKNYQLHKEEDHLHTALYHLEDAFAFIQSQSALDSKQSFHELENKYNKAKMLNNIQQLKISGQRYLFYLVILVALVLFLITVLQKRKLDYSNQIAKQDKEINELMTKCYDLSKTIYSKNDLLELGKKDPENLLTKREEEILILSEKLRKSRHARLLMSEIGEKLASISRKITPASGKTNITSKMWNAISKEVQTVYPEFELKIHELCPELTDSDWYYCCFILFNFDSNEEAVLLGINPQSARQKKVRIKKRLGLPAGSGSLYDCFTGQLLTL